jgi:hybrid cluster-associated redox disulfide protein
MRKMNGLEINSQISMADLLNRWPKAVPVLIRRRMYCVGCSMSPFETVEEAARIYGLAAEELIAEIITEVNGQPPSI